MRDADGEWQLVACGLPWVTLAVPPLSEVGEQRPNLRPHAEPLTQHLCHLAGSDGMALVKTSRSRQSAHHLAGPDQRRIVGGRQGPHHPTHRVSAGAEHHRDELGQQRVVRTEEIRGNFGIGGAAGVEQQARVIGIGSRLSVDPEPLAQAHGDERALEAVLER